MKYEFANRVQTLRTSFVRDNAKKNMTDKELISFAYGYPPVDAFPMERLRLLSEQMYTEVDPEVFLQYGDSEGYAPLRKQIQSRLQKTVGIPSDEEVIVVSGSTQAMELTVKLFVNEGDIVLCEAQTFSGAVNAIKSYGGVPLALPMDLVNQSIDLEAVEKALRADSEGRIKLIYLIPTFQNPLGTTMPLEQRKALYALAQEYDVLIFEDDPYGDLLYYGEPVPKIKSIDTDGRVIYAGSFSKILAPSTRTGFIMASPEVLAKLNAVKQVSDSHTNFYWQVMLSRYMDQYDFEAHVDELKLLYKEKMDRMVKHLSRIPKDLLDFITPTGGYFINCRLSTTVDATLFFALLAEAKVAVIPGNIMTVEGTGYERDFRLNFTKPTLDQIDRGMDLLHAALLKAIATPASVGK